jgi:dienelactone hydrolase
MKTETIEYKDGDVTCRGFLAYDDALKTKRPGILVMPEALGLGEHAREKARRLVQLGYVAFAGDPYGNGLEVQTIQEAMGHATPLFEDAGKLRQRGRAALDKLASLPQVDTNRLAAIGFCMGGTFALELARAGAPLKAAVGFHAGLQTRQPATGPIKTKILVCTGADDTLIPPAQVNAFAEEMSKVGADWQIITYGGTKHSFTNPEADRHNIPGIGYNKMSDQRSWKAMAAFFEEVFGQ